MRRAKDGLVRTGAGRGGPCLAAGLADVASAIFGVLLVVFPRAGALTVVWLIGVYVLVFGVLLLGLAYRRWRAQRELSGDDVAGQAG